MAVYDDPPWVHELLGILQRRKLTFARSLRGAAYDVVELGGGDASSTVISPGIFDTFVAPYDAPVIAAAHQAGQRIVYHTCGGMMPLLERIAAMQPDAMETFTPAGMGGDADLAEAKRRIGEKVCMIGGFDQFHFFQGCSAEQTRAEVRRCFEAAGQGGGYILCPSDHFFDAEPALIRICRGGTGLHLLNPVTRLGNTNINNPRSSEMLTKKKTTGAAAVWIALLGVTAIRAADPIANVDKHSARSEILLSGEDWKLGSFPMDEGQRQNAFAPGFAESGFRSVKVPAEIQLTLGLQGGDLYRQSKELSTINEREWWYRKPFVVPLAHAGKRIRLVLEGSDYFTSVWLNGEKLGDHEGCYTGFSFDITPHVKLGAENLLAVKVTCPWLPRDRAWWNT